MDKQKRRTPNPPLRRSPRNITTDLHGDRLLHHHPGRGQSRPLDAIYPVLLIDAIHVKIRDGQVANRPVYVAVGSIWLVSVTCWRSEEHTSELQSRENFVCR